MEIKTIIGLVISIIMMSCDQKDFTLQELKGVYHEVNSSEKLNTKCTLEVRDSTLEVRGCELSKNYIASKINISEQKLWYYRPEHDLNSFFEIERRGDKILIKEFFDDDEVIVWQKIN